MKKYNWVKRVCVVDSAYSLLIYFLISTEEEINSTFYFWNYGIPEQVRKCYSNKSFFYNIPPKRKGLFYFFMYYVVVPLRWPFLLSDKISRWGHDHIEMSYSIIRNFKINIIEDGIKNYYPQLPFCYRYPRLKGFLFGRSYINKAFCFEHDWVQKEYLTGLMDAPSMHSDKLVQISISRLWKESTDKKKKYILDVFGVDDSDIAILNKCDSILLTQPYSEDGFVSESAKIEYYRNKLSLIEDSGIIIKPHPREKTQYELFFPNTPVFRKKIPLELLLLCGAKLKSAYTINTTAIYDFPADTIKVVWGQEDFNNFCNNIK